MKIADRDRMIMINKKIEWFVDNQYDIRLDIVGPLLYTIYRLLDKIYVEQVCEENDITKIENILREAEISIMPEDAHLYTYDPCYKIWG